MATAAGDDVERRRRAVGVLHRLAPAHRASTPEEVADSLVALHSTDPASVYVAIVARTAGDGAPVDAVDRALYDEQTIVRVLAMRRTMWAVPSDAVPVVVGACPTVRRDERRRVTQALGEQGVAADPERYLDVLLADTLAALAELGEALPEELAATVPTLKQTIKLGGDSKWAAEVNLASRAVILLSADGRITRVRPRGSWTSTRHRYAVSCHAGGDPVDPADAQAALAARWLARFGPASVDPLTDLKWWAGWTVGATKQALAAVDLDLATEPDLDDPGAGPWAALVPALDPSTMGWRDRSWYLDPDLVPQLFDRNGNAGPAIWWCGQVVGGWAHRPTGEVATRLLVDIGRDGEAAVEAEAERLQRWLDAAGAVVKPRFPTPLARELAQ